MKGSAVIHQAMKRPGPAPRLSESVRFTPALDQEMIGEPGENHVFRRHPARVQAFFPGFNERRRSNRRKRDLWSAIRAIRVCLQIVLEALELEETAAIDSAPVPCVGDTREKRHSDVLTTADDGVCRSKALKDFGCTLHCVISLTGVIMSVLLTPASPSENLPVVERLDSFSHHLKRVLGDGASNDADVQPLLKQYRGLQLLAPVTVNHPAGRSKQAQQQINRSLTRNFFPIK